MSGNGAMAAPAGDADSALGFVIPARNLRGRLVRFEGVLREVLGAHSYPPVIEALVGEALVLAALLGTMLKDESGQLTLQAQTDNGPVSLLVADYRGRAVRGYAQYDAERLAEVGDKPSLFGLFGKGFLGVTFDLAATGERYQGIVPLEGESLAEAAEHYFAQSEQIPSVARIAVTHRPSDGACVAAGLLLQHLPEGEVGRERLHVRHDHPDWEHGMALARTLGAEELTDLSLPMRDIVWRLFHDEGEIRVTDGEPLAKGCRCDAAYIASVLARFPEVERADMADADGNILVDCAFCSRQFAIAAAGS